MTKKIYYDEKNLRKFESKIINIEKMEDCYIIKLDQTAFFPGGGGQFCDIGKINDINIEDVFEQGEDIYHKIKKDVFELNPLEIDQTVFCEIDWQNRRDGMAQHSAQHVISAIFFTLFDKNTTAFHMGAEISTVDIEGKVTESMIQKAQEKINQLIQENVEINNYVLDKSKIEKTWTRRPLPTTSEQIRIVEIGDIDTNACCGLHMQATGEIKVITICKHYKHKQSTRIEYVAGNRAIKYLLKRNDYLNGVCKNLNCDEKNLDNTIKNLEKRSEEQQNKIKLLEKKLVCSVSEQIIKQNESMYFVKCFEGYDMDFVKRVSEKICKQQKGASIFFLKENESVKILLQKSKDLKNIDLKEIFNKINLPNKKGGGSEYLIQGRCDFSENIKVELKKITQNIESLV